MWFTSFLDADFFHETHDPIFRVQHEHQDSLCWRGGQKLPDDIFYIVASFYAFIPVSTLADN